MVLVFFKKRPAIFKNYYPGRYLALLTKSGKKKGREGETVIFLPMYATHNANS